MLSLGINGVVSGSILIRKVSLLRGDLYIVIGKAVQTCLHIHERDQWVFWIKGSCMHITMLVYIIVLFHQNWAQLHMHELWAVSTTRYSTTIQYRPHYCHYYVYNLYISLYCFVISSSIINVCTGLYLAYFMGSSVDGGDDNRYAIRIYCICEQATTITVTLEHIKTFNEVHIRVMTKYACA